MIAEIKKRDTIIEELARIVEEEKKTTAELIMEIDILKRHLVIYENAHAPSSHGSVSAQQKKIHSARGVNHQNILHLYYSLVLYNEWIIIVRAMISDDTERQSTMTMRTFKIQVESHLMR